MEAPLATDKPHLNQAEEGDSEAASESTSDLPTGEIAAAKESETPELPTALFPPVVEHGHSQAPDRKQLATIALAALGVVYGDIGTSPLYALKECVHGEHGVVVNPENILGLLSLMFWSLIMVVTVKYLTFVMRADNKGEGGVLALLGLLQDPGERPRTLRMGALVAAILFGAGLLYGDGAITPAISVLSAIEGLEVVAPGLDVAVVPITCGVLVALFAMQRKGTARVGALFGPVMVAWFAALAVLGIVQIVAYPAIFKALAPTYAVQFFLTNGLHGFATLGSVVLVITGGEALYADMGHFGRKPIRLAWTLIVLPSLLLNYFGQGALLLAHPEAAKNPFFALVPQGPLTFALVGLASAATVIASQALISGIYSLTNQAIQLGYFPRVTILHTSSDTEGQIYLPEVNWMLMFACVALVLGFKDSGSLAAAYGIAVTGTMIVTSLAWYAVTRKVWGWSLGKALPLVLVFLAFDSAFFGANLLKFFHGGYVPIAIGLAFFVVMVTWKRGRYLLSEHFARNALPMDQFIHMLDQDHALRVPGACVVMASTDQYIPLILTHHVHHTHVVHETVLLLTVRMMPTPRVSDAERVSARPIGQGIWRVIVKTGFMEQPNVPAALQMAVERFSLPARVPEITYFIGRETLIASNGGRMKRWQELLFAFLARNALTATAYFKLPPQQVVELGIQLDL